MICDSSSRVEIYKKAATDQVFTRQEYAPILSDSTTDFWLAVGRNVT